MPSQTLRPPPSWRRPPLNSLAPKPWQFTVALSLLPKGVLLRYFETEEGLTAQAMDPKLRQSLTRKELPPAPSSPLPAASTGRPIAKGSGVIVAPSADGMDEPPNLEPDEPSTRSPGRQRTGSRTGRSATKVRTIRDLPGSPSRVPPAVPPYVPAEPTRKSSAFDVYGNPRLASGHLPEVHTREEAEIRINDAYLDVEGSSMRVGKTSSLNLLRAKGQTVRQFQLSPKHLHFGTVPVGQVVHKVARLTNISQEIARFALVR